MVDGAGCFVADYDLRVSDQCTGEGHELALAEGEVEAVFFDGGVQVEGAGLLRFPWGGGGGGGVWVFSGNEIGLT